VKWTVLLCALLSGCAAHTHTQVNVGAASPHGGVQVHVEGGRGLAALLGLSILAAGIYETERVRYFVNPFVTVSGNSPEVAPPLAPDRRVSEQDCTKPLDYSLGNIRCK
jgi:hypothetical protein